MLAQHQTQKQTLKILPQQIQLLNLYFLNSLELEQRIKNELEENLFLETSPKTAEEDDETEKREELPDFQDWDESMYDDIPDYRSEYQNYFDSEVAPNTALVSVCGFREEAHKQLQLLQLPDAEKDAADYIIDILNANGFMDIPPDEVADDMSFHFQHVIDVSLVRRALAIVQSLEPLGLGSCSIKDCLLVQLNALDQKKPYVKQAVALISNQYDDLMHRQFEKIHHTMKISDDDLRAILNLIGSLKFHPVTEAATFDQKNTIIPDYLITNYGGNLQVSLLSGRSGTVFVNQSLHDELSGKVSSKDKSTTQYVRTKFNDAQWFVNAVKQRENTMLQIMKCIVEIQKDYFADGDIRLLKPMVLRHIAEISGLDISTISRITGNKYAQTHFGIICIKKLFSEGIADKKGDVISNKVIQSVIAEAVASEDKVRPYTDQQLVSLLTSSGFNIARRTIAKYRDQMNIPIAQIRAVWA